MLRGGDPRLTTAEVAAILAAGGAGWVLLGLARRIKSAWPATLAVLGVLVTAAIAGLSGDAGLTVTIVIGVVLLGVLGAEPWNWS